MVKLQNVTRAHLGLLLANLVWAVNYPFYKVLMPHYITPVALATFAVTVAGLLGLVSLFGAASKKIDRNDIYKFIGAALLMGIAKKLLLMIGMQHTSPIEASIIATLGPILVLVFSFFFGIDRFTPMKVFGMVLGMGGALLVILSGGGAVTSGEKLMGNLFVVGAIAASSFSMVWLKGLIMKYRPITVLRVYYPMAAVMLLPFGFDSMIHTDFAAMPAEALWMFFYVILIPTFGPNYLLIFSLHYVKPTISSVFFLPAAGGSRNPLGGVAYGSFDLGTGRRGARRLRGRFLRRTFVQIHDLFTHAPIGRVRVPGGSKEYLRYAIWGR